MKHKVAELEAPMLDTAVAKANAEFFSETDMVLVDGGRFSPSTDWFDGGPIIEREHIATEFHQGDGVWTAAVRSRRVSWEDWENDGWGEGSTLLIAAMRAYVASKFGEEVELP